MTKAERELTLFINDPTYREEVITRVHKEQDRDYERRIKSLRSDKERLISDRKKMMTKISNERWESLYKGKLYVNKTEGKIKINSGEFLFSDILGAEPNVQLVYRVETNTKGESKKHVSLGGAVVGGLVSGGIGAVAGGLALGKRTNKGTSVENQIPICYHLGVAVNINGFISEIVILTKQVEQSSDDYIEAEAEALKIISTLTECANTPVPTSFLAIEDEDRVKDYDERIVRKEQDIEVAILDKPTYRLPEMYRTDEQKEMSDEEYLEYLAKEDELRGDTPNKAVASRKALHIIGEVFGWVISVLIFGFACFATYLKGLAGGIFFIGAAVSINPLLYKVIKSKWYFARRWIFILACIGSIIMGIVGMTAEPAEEVALCLTADVFNW